MHTSVRLNLHSLYKSVGIMIFEQLISLSFETSHFAQHGLFLNSVFVRCTLVRPNVMVKLNRLLSAHAFCAIQIKFKILNTYVNLSLLYRCETWADVSLLQLECIQRKIIKSVLGVRRNTPNYIIIIETGIMPLKANVQQRQNSFGINWYKTHKMIHLRH